MLSGKTSSLACCALLLVAFACVSWAGDSPYEHEETKKLAALVEDAARLVESKGEAAFAEFRVKGSRWYHGSTYVFVEDDKGGEIVNPPSPNLEGTSLIGLRDAKGRPFVRSIIEALYGPNGKKSAWVHYLWPEPGAIDPSWKSSYIIRVTAPSGKRYVVGSGLYNMKMERAFLVDKVNKACALIEKSGPKAFAAIRNPISEFVFNETYVFVNDRKGVELVNPAFPGLEGRNLMRFLNEEGLPIVRMYIDLVKKKGQGWIAYYFPKPGKKKPSLKHVYVKGAKYGGDLYIVGCGYYF